MFGIIYFTLVTTAAGRDNLFQIGFLLFIAAILHNSAGYFFGYYLSRVCGLYKKAVVRLLLKWVYKTEEWHLAWQVRWVN